MFTLDTNESIPLHEITEEGGVITIDSGSSTLDGVAVGLTSGTHKYSFTRDRHVADLTATETQLSLSAIANVSETSGVWSKTSNTNGWNAAVKSDTTFDANEVFAISWEIDSTGNWTRMMCGLAAITSATTYRNLLLGLYQINDYLYTFYYASGKATHNEDIDYDNRNVAVGDRFVISVSAGMAKFYIMKGSVLYPMGMPSINISGDVKFMGCLNRGSNKTGATTLTNVYSHTATKLDNTHFVLTGASNEELDTTDISNLADIGFTVLSGSTYGKIKLSRNSSSAFIDNGVESDCDIVHEFYGISRQETSTF